MHCIYHCIQNDYVRRIKEENKIKQRERENSKTRDGSFFCDINVWYKKGEGK